MASSTSNLSALLLPPALLFFTIFSMAKACCRPPLLLFCLLICLLFFSCAAQSCVNYAFSNGRAFSSCNDLPFLNSSLHWNYNPSSGMVDIAYRHTGVTSSRWFAWAINPNTTGMVGSQAFIAYQGTDGKVVAYTSPITSYRTHLEEGNLSFPVSHISAIFGNNEMIIFATLELPNKSTTTVNQVWQEGPLSGNTPGAHSFSGPNVRSMATLDFLSGQAVSIQGGNSRATLKNVHGVMNAVSWGILMPIGAIVARYLKVFNSADPTWFYLHITCQSTAYMAGVAGWATGLKLGRDSSGIQYDAHRIIGIILFCLATLQVFALHLRPNKDHKYRVYWNVYHHLTGYTVVILSIVNVFKGFAILDPEEKWKKAYICIIGVLGSIALLLEGITWYIVLKRKSRISDKSQCSLNGENGVTNGYEAAV